jgi:hypothetical protein
MTVSLGFLEDIQVRAQRVGEGVVDDRVGRRGKRNECSAVPRSALGKKWELILKHERLLQIPSGLSNVAYS